MPLTVVTDVAVKQAGNIKIVLGPKITSLAAPSLAAFTLDATCPARELNFDTAASYTEDQSLCEVDAKTTLDKRTHSLTLRFRVNKANFETLRTLLAWDAEIGVFARFFDPSLTALAAADKGYAWNAKVGKYLLNPIAIGNEYEATVEFYEVKFEPNAALAA